jgi:hypothetical protein
MRVPPGSPPAIRTRRSRYSHQLSLGNDVRDVEQGARLGQQLRGSHYAITNPPLTSTTAPVMKLAWSEQRNATTSATS